MFFLVCCRFVWFGVFLVFDEGYGVGGDSMRREEMRGFGTELRRNYFFIRGFYVVKGIRI